MRRQLGVGLLSRIARNGCSSSSTHNNASSLLSPNSVLKSNWNSFHHRSLSEHSTLSRSHLWKICRSSNGVVPGVILPSRRLFSNALWKGRAKVPVTIGNGRFYNSFNSLDRGRISVDNFKSGRLHTLVTSAFSHKDPSHLISNMIGLYFFGMSIGHTFGAEYLLNLYLAGAIAGSIFYLAYHALIAPSLQGEPMQGIRHSMIPALGASGAVNAIMLLDIFLFPTKTLYFDFFIPVPAILLGIFMIGKDMLRVLEGDPKVSGSAHLGGAAVGAIAWLKHRKGRFGRF